MDTSATSSRKIVCRGRVENSRRTCIADRPAVS
jgi:hypothetical protein